MMHTKNNQYTVHTHEGNNKIKESIAANIQDKALKSANLKRAFTVIPSPVKANIVNEYSSNTERIQLDEKVSENSEWPSLEELEALIRGQREAQQNTVEWLELPLQFDKQREHIVEQPIEIKHHIVPEKQFPPISNRFDEQFEEYEPTTINKLSMSWGKIATAITSSIITGVLIGYVLLLAVYGVKVWPVNIISERIAQSEATTATTLPVTSPELIDVTTEEGVENIEAPGMPLENKETLVSETLVIQPVQSFTYTALQAGVFSKHDTKQAMIDTLKSKGFPATSIATYDDKYVVFAGVSSTQQATYQLNHMENTEFYRKPFSLHVPHLSSNEALDQQLQQWMFNIQDLLSSYMKISEAQFEQESFSAFYEESYSLLQQKSNHMIKETATLKETLVDETLKEKLIWHEQAIQNIDKLLANYQQKSNVAALFAVQQQLLDIIAYQSEWFMN